MHVTGTGLTSYNGADIAMAMPFEKESQIAAHPMPSQKLAGIAQNN
jgi:hypothetical protein